MNIDLYTWQCEVAKAITQLSQEVHALNPGIAFDFNLSVIRAPIDGEPQALASDKANEEPT